MKFSDSFSSSWSAFFFLVLLIHTKRMGQGKRKDGCLNCDSEDLRDEEGLMGGSWQNLF